MEQGSDPKIVIHIISIFGFTKEKNLELTNLHNRVTQLPLLSGSSYDYKYNFEGYTTFISQNGNYVQIFRQGFLEAVDKNFFSQHDKKIYVTRFESPVIEGTKKYIKILSTLDVKGPYLLNTTLLGASEHTLFLPFSILSRAI